MSNSFQGAILAMELRRVLYVFSRGACSNKIENVLGTAGIPERLVCGSNVQELPAIDYDQVWERFHAEREKSLDYLKGALEL